MKTDLYTKAILTVIAIALVCIVFQNANIITPANANTTNSLPALPSSTTNAIVNEPTAGTIDVNIVSFNGERARTDYYGRLKVAVD